MNGSICINNLNEVNLCIFAFTFFILALDWSFTVFAIILSYSFIVIWIHYRASMIIWSPPYIGRWPSRKLHFLLVTILSTILVILCSIWHSLRNWEHLVVFISFCLGYSLFTIHKFNLVLGSLMNTRFSIILIWSFSWFLTQRCVCSTLFLVFTYLF